MIKVGPFAANSGGVLRSLARDTRAATLAMVAAAFLPLAAMVGGGLDLSRLYLAKTRLQQACDAGALAGRKVMGGGTWAASSGAANAAATNFFDTNFQQGAYGTGTLTKAFAESGGKVTGTASVVVPMTLMRIFLMPQQTLTVTCDADMRLPNTDVMFVLDTTGSMAEKASPGDASSKIVTLKYAVKCFYETLARLDTDANCGSAPSGGVGSQVQIRFGFMPYATNVNVGKLLPTSYFANNWSYQSRAPRWWIRQGTPQVSSNNITQTNVPQSSCNDATAASAGYNSNSDSYSNNNTTKTNTNVNTHVTKWTSANGGTCSATQTKTVTTYNLQENVAGGPNDQFIDYRYGQISQPVSGLKNGSSWRSSFTLPLGASGASKTINWDGCIEERHTVRGSSYSPIPSDADDLQIDEIPASGDADSLWGPALPDTIFTRGETSARADDSSDWIYGSFTSTAEYINGSAYYCPTEARKLQVWNTDAFDGYVDSLTPDGNTYHDIGMLWGARFISPTGIFASENAKTPRGGEIQRNIIFMTDGDTNAPPTDYNAYGVPWFDRRQTSTGAAPSQTATQDQVNARFLAICNAVKNSGKVTIWVISFGNGSNATTEARLKACSSDDHFYAARSASDLQDAFQSIANQISQLRLTK